MAEQFFELFPSSRWMTYSAAAERLGLQRLVAARARRGRWRTRTRGDTGEAEVEVPYALLDIDFVEIKLKPDLAFRERVAQAVSQVDRPEAKWAREDAFADSQTASRSTEAAMVATGQVGSTAAQESLWTILAS